MKISASSCLRLVVALTLLLVPALQAQQNAPKATPPIATGGEVAARAAGEVWLALLDDGQYEKTWDTAAKILRDLVKKDAWVNLIQTKRPPLGKVVARHLKETNSTKTLPGAPAGTYVVFQYETEFEHKKPALETVTVATDPDGQWKVSGYYIR